MQGKTWGKALSWMLNWIQPDHGAGAIAGNAERAENIDKIEGNSGAL